eukprot:257985_1
MSDVKHVIEKVLLILTELNCPKCQNIEDFFNFIHDISSILNSILDDRRPEEHIFDYDIIESKLKKYPQSIQILKAAGLRVQHIKQIKVLINHIECKPLYENVENILKLLDTYASKSIECCKIKDREYKKCLRQFTEYIDILSHDILFLIFIYLPMTSQISILQKFYECRHKQMNENKKSYEIYYSVWDAIRADDLDFVTHIFSTKPMVKALTDRENCKTPLMICAQLNRIQMFKAIYKKYNKQRAYPVYRDDQGWTALFYALCGGNLRIASELMNTKNCYILKHAYTYQNTDNNRIYFSKYPIHLKDSEALTSLDMIPNTFTRQQCFKNVSQLDVEKAYSRGTKLQRTFYELSFHHTLNNPDPNHVHQICYEQADDNYIHWKCPYTKQGIAYAWGHNNHYQLCLGKKSNYFYTPKMCELLIKMSIKHISSSGYHAIGLTHECDEKWGNVWVWGNNTDGRLGIGGPKQKYVKNPIRLKVKGERFKSSTSTLEHSTLLSIDGKVFMFGTIMEKTVQLEPQLAKLLNKRLIWNGELRPFCVSDDINYIHKDQIKHVSSTYGKSVFTGNSGSIYIIGEDIDLFGERVFSLPTRILFDPCQKAFVGSNWLLLWWPDGTVSHLKHEQGSLSEAYPIELTKTYHLGQRGSRMTKKEIQIINVACFDDNEHGRAIFATKNGNLYEWKSTSEPSQAFYIGNVGHIAAISCTLRSCIMLTHSGEVYVLENETTPFQFTNSKNSIESFTGTKKNQFKRMLNLCQIGAVFAYKNSMFAVGVFMSPVNRTVNHYTTTDSDFEIAENEPNMYERNETIVKESNTKHYPQPLGAYCGLNLYLLLHDIILKQCYYDIDDKIYIKLKVAVEIVIDFLIAGTDNIHSSVENRFNIKSVISLYKDAIRRGYDTFKERLSEVIVMNLGHFIEPSHSVLKQCNETELKIIEVKLKTNFFPKVNMESLENAATEYEYMDCLHKMEEYDKLNMQYPTTCTPFRRPLEPKGKKRRASMKREKRQMEKTQKPIFHQQKQMNQRKFLVKLINLVPNCVQKKQQNQPKRKLIPVHEKFRTYLLNRQNDFPLLLAGYCRMQIDICRMPSEPMQIICAFYWGVEDTLKLNIAERQQLRAIFQEIVVQHDPTLRMFSIDFRYNEWFNGAKKPVVQSNSWFPIQFNSYIKQKQMEKQLISKYDAINIKTVKNSVSQKLFNNTIKRKEVCSYGNCIRKIEDFIESKMHANKNMELTLDEYTHFMFYHKSYLQQLQVYQCDISKCANAKRCYETSNELECGITLRNLNDRFHCYILNHTYTEYRNKSAGGNLPTIRSKRWNIELNKQESCGIMESIYNLSLKQPKDQVVVQSLVEFVKQNEYDSDSLRYDLSEKEMYSNIGLLVGNTHLMNDLKQMTFVPYHMNNGLSLSYWRHSLVMYVTESNQIVTVKNDTNSFYIKKKWNSLKEEMLNNTIASMGCKQFSSSYKDAKNLSETSIARSLKSQNEQLRCRLNIKSLDIQHILSALIYTNNNTLSIELKYSFQYQKGDTCIEDVKSRNSQFWHLSKALCETVELWGERGVNVSQNCLFIPVNSKNEIPVSQMKFLEFDMRLYAPTSATRNKATAAELSPDGIVMELRMGKTYGSANVSAFDVSWLSRYPMEQEMLLMGGLWPLDFGSLINIAQRSDDKLYLESIFYFNCMLSDNDITDHISSEHRAKIMELLQKQCTSDYISQTFRHYLKGKKQIILNIPRIIKSFSTLMDLVVCCKTKTYILNDSLFIQFHKLEQIIVYINPKKKK